MKFMIYVIETFSRMINLGLYLNDMKFNKHANLFCLFVLPILPYLMYLIFRKIGLFDFQNVQLST